MKAFKAFIKPFEVPQRTFWGTAKKYKNKNLTQFLFQYNFQKCMGRSGLIISCIDPAGNTDKEKTCFLMEINKLTSWK